MLRHPVVMTGFLFLHVVVDSMVMCSNPFHGNIQDSSKPSPDVISAVKWEVKFMLGPHVNLRFNEVQILYSKHVFI